MKKLLSLVVTIMIAATTFAQVNEVTLTVIGTGPTEEKATLQALRSAIEQSFGTFVSANTTILNDQLVQDEIVSVSNGNIKEYQKLAVATIPNGQVSVSIRATVSVNKLILYAKSKGSRAEFAGQTFAANTKIMKLRQQSTQKAMNLLFQQLELIAKDMFDFTLDLGDPILIGPEYNFYPTINVYSNEASTNFYHLLFETLEALKLSDEEITFCRNVGIETANFDGDVCIPKENIGIFDHKDSYGIKYKRFTLPISKEGVREYLDWLSSILGKAYFRFSLVEIDNPTGKYVAMKFNNNVSHERNNDKWFRRAHEPYVDRISHWASRHLCFAIGKTMLTIDGIFMIEFKGTMYEHGLYCLKPSLCLKETKTPIKLTGKQKQEVKKGTYNGPLYSISYSNPQLLISYITRIPVSKLDMENGKFKGLEIQF